MASVRKRTWQTKAGEKSAFVVAYTHKGKQHLKTFRTKREATAWRAEMQHEVKEGIHTPATASITVAEAGALWLAQAEIDDCEASTVMQYRQHLNYHITPFLGDVKLAELAPASIQEFRNALIKEGRPQTEAEAKKRRSRDGRVPVSQVMAKKVTSSLGAILAHAMTAGRVVRNVVREQARQQRTRQRRLEKRHDKRLEVGVDIPTKDEIRAMLTAAQGRWRPLVVTAVFTGLRASELRGLTWADVDLDRATLRVRQRADRWNKIGSPKSGPGQREVPLVPMAVNTLKEWRLACPKGELDLVFPNRVGKIETLPSIHRRGLGRIEVAAGVSTDKLRPKYGLHSLRHAAASLFIEQGFSPKRVQALMGHSSIQMTFDTYGHLFPSKDDDAAAMQQLQARLVG
jgi:integrase